MTTARIPEKVLQQQGVQLLRARGAAVYVIGTRRRKGDYPGTCMSAGIPDVLAFLPANWSTADAPRQLWWEVKTADGRATPQQLAFAEHCARAGQAYVRGDLDALVAWLVAHGYLKADNVAHYRRPCVDVCFTEIAQHGGVSARCAAHGRTHKEAVASR
jgi:hypothetical protein